MRLVGGSKKWWAGGGVAAIAAGLLGLSAVPAGAAFDPNLSFARTQGLFGVSWGYFNNLAVTFKMNQAVNVSFRVNGVTNFTNPSVPGPIVNDPSNAIASGNQCTGCMTNAIAITVDVVSGPVSTVIAPTTAQATENYCNACNTLAADYTFVVSPGTTTGLTSSALAQLSGLAAQLNAEAHTVQPSSVLAGEVVAALQGVAGVLSNPGSYTSPPAPQAAPRAQLAPATQAPGVPVQQFGSTQTAS